MHCGLRRFVFMLSASYAAEGARAKLVLVTTSNTIVASSFRVAADCEKAVTTLKTGGFLISKGDPPGAVPYAIAMCFAADE